MIGTMLQPKSAVATYISLSLCPGLSFYPTYSDLEYHTNMYPSSYRGLHSCAPGIFTCEAPNCTWPRTFKTKQALNGHYHAKHHNDRVDCPIEGCARVGAQGIKRADNLAAHMLNKHGISHPRMSFGN